MKPLLSIITVTMNHFALLKRMLTSLYVEATPSCSFELIVIDNCSTDGTEEYIKTHYPQINYIKNENIAGFAANNNRGAAIAEGDYMLVLNPDIILLPGSIDQLMDYLQTHPDVGIVAPRLLNTDHTLQYSARTFISPSILLARLLTKGKDGSNNGTVQQYLLKNISNEAPSEVDWCMGAALLLRKTLYAQLKGFDEHFFLYVEDMDLCHRCWKFGKKVVYLPSSSMVHAHQRSSTKLNKKTWLHLKSIFYFWKKNRYSIQRNHTAD